MKILIIATAGLALSLCAARADPIRPNGPQPYQAVDPVYAPMAAEPTLAKEAYVPPLLFLKGDEAAGSAAGPQPYRAPTPAY